MRSVLKIRTNLTEIAKQFTDFR